MHYIFFSTRSQSFKCDSPRTSQVGVVSDSRDARQQGYHWNNWLLGTVEGQWCLMFVVGAFLIFAGTISWRLTPGTLEFPAQTLYQSLWMSYTLWADVGTQTGLTAQDPGICSSVAIFFSFLGFVYNLALLGLVVDVIRTQLSSWKDTKNRVSATDHMLILGWSDKTLYLLNELIAAKQKFEKLEGKGGCCRCKKRHKQRIVILADKSVEKMSQHVRTYFGSKEMKRRGLTPYMKYITFRKGDPVELNELGKAGATCAKTILILGVETPGVSSDDHVMQHLLAIADLNIESHETVRKKVQVLADLQSPDSVKVMKDIFPAAHGVVARSHVNRILVLRAVVPSIGYTYLQMTSFNTDCEFFFRSVPQGLIGSSFLTACYYYPGAVVLGVKTNSTNDHLETNWTVALPGASYLLQDTDELVLMARTEKDVTMVQTTVSHKEPPLASETKKFYTFDDLVMPDGQLKLGSTTDGPKVLVMIGCPADFTDFLQILDCYLAQGSKVHILSQRQIEEPYQDSRLQAMRKFFDDPALSIDGTPYLKRIQVFHYVGQANNKTDIKKIVNLKDADFALVLSDPQSIGEDPICTDQRSFTSVILLRQNIPKTKTSNTEEKKRSKKCKVVTELVHPKSRQVVESRKGDDDKLRRHGSFVYSTALETALFALASHTAGTRQVYDILLNMLDPGGEAGHVATAPLRNFMRDNEELSFFDLHVRVMQTCDGVLLGWRDPGKQYPVLNPENKASIIDLDAKTSAELIIFCRKPQSTAATTDFDQPVSGSESKIPHVPDEVKEGSSSTMASTMLSMP